MLNIKGYRRMSGMHFIYSDKASRMSDQFFGKKIQLIDIEPFISIFVYTDRFDRERESNDNAQRFKKSSSIFYRCSNDVKI